MTTPVVSAMAFLPGMDSNEAPARRVYRTTKSFVAVHFDHTSKGRIVFLPHQAILHVIGPSACLPEGFEIVFEDRHYNVFAVDVLE